MPAKRKTEMQLAKEAEAIIRKNTGSAGSTPIYVSPPTQGGITFYQIGKDPRHAARLRGNKERGTDSSSKRVLVK